MESTGIFIGNNNPDILKTALATMPQAYIDGLKWKILFIDGVTSGTGAHTSSLVKEFNAPEFGTSITWERLNEIITSFIDLQDILLIGSVGTNLTARKDMDPKEISFTSAIVIEFFDSSYYNIYSYDNQYIQSLKNLFSNMKLKWQNIEICSEHSKCPKTSLILKPS